VAPPARIFGAVQRDDRYAPGWREEFVERARESLAEGTAVLDVGAGRTPTFPPAERPAGCVVVALDASQEELDAAPAGAYDERVVGDVGDRVPRLEGRFDLAVSFQVLEHVQALDRTLGNLHAYLRPGGRLVALVSGSFSAFALLNRAVPERLGVAAMRRLLDREPDSVFSAHYDRCWHGALVELLEPWSRAEVVPIYRGADYFAFSRPLRAAYLAYEDWAARGGHRNLATHYVLDATR
jgi:SAM-dependent methyltransferase